eukprot:scaffold1483_cov379-Prasinococcus_capsulatus_cf.AAC.7
MAYAEKTSRTQIKLRWVLLTKKTARGEKFEVRGSRGCQVQGDRAAAALPVRRDGAGPLWTLTRRRPGCGGRQRDP